jgi:lipoprotein-releasing system permease protein
MLGVATLIVTNAVMEGFTHEMQDRIHGILSDLVFESPSLDGFENAELRMAEIKKVAGPYIGGMSPTVHVPAMLGYSVGSEYFTRQITVIGLDETTYSTVSDFGKFLQHPDNREHLDFNLKVGGYDIIDHQATDRTKVSPRFPMQDAGWIHRRRKAKMRPQVEVPKGSLDGNPFQQSFAPAQTPLEASSNGSSDVNSTAEGTAFDPARDQHPGCVLGIGLCAFRMLDGSDGFYAVPGDDVEISYPTSAKPPKVLSTKFTAVDFYECKMSEYDSNFVFVPIRKLQDMRGMIDPSTGIARCNAIQIRLKEGVD